MQRVKGQSTQYNVVLKVEFKYLKGFICPKAIADKCL